MPRRLKRFGNLHEEEVFKNIRKKEFQSYASYLTISSSSEESFRYDSQATPEKVRGCQSDPKGSILPHEPPSIEITTTGEQEENSITPSNSGEYVATNVRKSKMARNSTLNMGGKAIDCVTFGSCHMSSIVPQESGLSPSRAVEESCVKGKEGQYSSLSEISPSFNETSSVENDSNCSEMDETEDNVESLEAKQSLGNSPRLVVKRTLMPHNTPTLITIQEGSSSVRHRTAPSLKEFSEVELHLPDKISKPVPRIITSSLSGPCSVNLPETIELSSITRCGEGDDSSGLVFRPESRDVISAEVISLTPTCLKRRRTFQSPSNDEEFGTLDADEEPQRSSSCSVYQHLSAVVEDDDNVNPNLLLSSPANVLRNISNVKSPASQSPKGIQSNFPNVSGNNSQEKIRQVDSEVENVASDCRRLADENADYEFLYPRADSYSVQIGSRQILAHDVDLSESWTQTSKSVVVRELPSSLSRKKYIPLSQRSAEEQKMIADVKLWIQGVPETSCTSVQTF